MIAFSLPANVPVYLFSLLVGLGAVTGLVGVARNAPEKEARRRVDAGLWALGGALVGGRVGFVVAHWAYFQLHSSEIAAVYLGGISASGALLGSVLALTIYAIVTQMAFGIVADSLLPLLASMTVVSWLSCWLAGVAYGPLSNAWWGLPARDEWGTVAPRLPLQFLGALLSVGLFASLEMSRERWKFAGRAAALGLLGLALQLFALSFLRADPAPLWRGLHPDAWGAIGLGFLSLILLFLSSHETHSCPRSNQHPSG
jgi:prolipoprotein diacylglyceryltransferase